MLDIRNVTFTGPDPRRSAAFWAAALDLPEVIEHGQEVLVARSDWSFPRFSFQQGDTHESPSPPAVHIDLTASDRTAEVERLVLLGATVVRTMVDDEASGLTWTVMHDPDGNPFCVTEEKPARTRPDP